MSAEEICLCVLRYGQPLREENDDVPPDGFSPQLMALLAKRLGAGAPNLIMKEMAVMLSMWSLTTSLELTNSKRAY